MTLNKKLVDNNTKEFFNYIKGKYKIKFDTGDFYEDNYISTDIDNNTKNIIYIPENSFLERSKTF